MAASHFTTTEKFESKIKKLASDYELVLRGINEVQKFHVTGGVPTSGQWRFNFDGELTGNLLDFNEDIAQIENEFAAMAKIGNGDVRLWGGPLPGTDIFVEFRGNQGSKDVPLMTITDDTLNNGASMNCSLVTAGEATDSVHIARRLEDAYQEILGALVQRGLTVVQVSTWARGEEFQLDIATYWYCKDSGWGGKDPDTEDWTKVFDRREELKTIPILDNSGSELAKGEGPVGSHMNLLAINENLGYEY